MSKTFNLSGPVVQCLTTVSDSRGLIDWVEKAEKTSGS